MLNNILVNDDHTAAVSGMAKAYLQHLNKD